MTTPTGADRLKASIRRLLSRPPRPPLNMQPETAFEAVLLQRLEAIDADLDRLRTRVNWLLGLIIAAALANILSALL